MLRYQVNPHFLFNSLNSLRALIDENPAAARTMVTQLAELFRHSLRTTPRRADRAPTRSPRSATTSTSRRSASTTRSTRPSTSTSRPRRPRSPGFLIHPLVENAVKYGLETSDKPLRVRVRVRREVDRLDVLVDQHRPLARRRRAQRRRHRDRPAQPARAARAPLSRPPRARDRRGRWPRARAPDPRGRAMMSAHRSSTTSASRGASSSRLLSRTPEIAVVGEAASVDEAAALVRTLDPDVVFLDIQMPRRSGLRAARGRRRARPRRVRHRARRPRDPRVRGQRARLPAQAGAPGAARRHDRPAARRGRRRPRPRRWARARRSPVPAATPRGAVRARARDRVHPRRRRLQPRSCSAMASSCCRRGRSRSGRPACRRRASRASTAPPSSTSITSSASSAPATTLPRVRARRRGTAAHEPAPRRAAAQHLLTRGCASGL